MLNNYSRQQFDTKRYNDFDVRLDFNASPRDMLFARYSYQMDNDEKDALARYVGLPSGFGSGDNNTHPRGVGGGYTHIFGANAVNEFRFGLLAPILQLHQSFRGHSVFGQPRHSECEPQLLVGWRRADRQRNDGEILGYTGDGGPYEVPQLTPSSSWIPVGFWTHGKNTFKFGTNLIFREVDFFQGDYRSKGFFNISGNGADYTGYEVSELLAAFVDNYCIANPLGVYHTRNFENGFFAQDDWKVSPRLTLNLGLRYDVITWPYEEDNRQSNFDIASGKLLVAGVGGNSRSLINTNRGNLGPRLGFAYSPTVWYRQAPPLRGGYGIFYFHDRGGVGNQLSNNPDFNGASSFSSSSQNLSHYVHRAEPATLKTPPDNLNTDATSPRTLRQFRCE